MILFVDTDIGKLIYNFHSFKISNVEFFQKSQFRASEMTNIADFVDLMKLQKICVYIKVTFWVFLTLSNVEFSSKIKI